ncbi:MAG: class I SAM-dependent methyltransferase [Alphaproteobacteria bacterium]|nr:class I SAM-dependent methyltransferase [Alphaproteobacteria bacterium]
MIINSIGQRILEDAYRLSTPADNIAYYNRFAAHYDKDFVEEMGYRYPEIIAEAYHRISHVSDVPVADVGCGTGRGAIALGLAPEKIDGIDISPEMLAVAAKRGCYGALHCVDLTGSLDAISKGYGAVVSAGTFTFGHLGPEALVALLAIARTSALFVIGVNKSHFQARNFDETLKALEHDGRIELLGIEDIKLYNKTHHAHAEDRVLVVEFRKQ